MEHEKGGVQVMGQALTEREIERKHLSDADNPTVYFPNGLSPSKPERGQL